MRSTPAAIALIAITPAGLAGCNALDASQTEAASRFQRDPARMAAKQAEIIAPLRAQSPEAAAQLEASFRQNVVAAVQPAFKPYGFSTEDVVDMTAAYWITAWEASHGRAGDATDPAVARGVRAQLAKVMTPSLTGMGDAAKQDIADTMLLQTLIADARMTAARQGGAGAVQAMSDTIYREAAGILKTDLRAVDMTREGFRRAGAEQAAGPAAGSARPAGGGSAVAGVDGYYFRAVYGLGAAISFEPLVFFANGDYLEIAETPLADLDVAADKRRNAINWGRWRRQGGTFLLTDAKGRTSDYQLGKGNFFPAYPADSGPRLSGTYSNTTGGGDYALGGGVTTLAVDKIMFRADGSFTQGKSAGGVAPNAAIGSRSAAAGRWTLDGSTLDLSYGDGRRVRTSFLWGASGSPPRPDADMAFIGGDVFTLED